MAEADSRWFEKFGSVAWRELGGRGEPDPQDREQFYSSTPGTTPGLTWDNIPYTKVFLSNQPLKKGEVWYGISGVAYIFVIFCNVKTNKKTQQKKVASARGPSLSSFTPSIDRGSRECTWYTPPTRSHEGRVHFQTEAKVLKNKNKKKNYKFLQSWFH